MPIHKGSILNEEYTGIVTEIANLIKQAKEKYNALPDCIKNVENAHTRSGGNTLGYYLVNGVSCAKTFALEFGIDIDCA